MRTRNLIVISQGVEERVFFEILAARAGFRFVFCPDQKAFRSAIREHPESVVIWDLDGMAQHLTTLQTWASLLVERCDPDCVFLLCDDPSMALGQEFVQDLPFHHILRRRLSSACMGLLVPLLQATGGEDYPFGLERYFPSGSLSQSIRLRRSEHRRAAVDAVQSFLAKRKVKPRIARTVAQAVDELLLNAIFCAPHDANSTAIRRHLSRSAQFEFDRHEHIDVEIMSCDQYYAVRVTDCFGAMGRDTLLRAFAKDYRTDAYLPKGSGGASLGLRGLLGLGLSLVFVSKPGTRTDALLFWPTAKSHLEFKTSFQLLNYFGRRSGFVRSNRGE